MDYKYPPIDVHVGLPDYQTWFLQVKGSPAILDDDIGVRFKQVHFFSEACNVSLRSMCLMVWQDQQVNQCKRGILFSLICC